MIFSTALVIAARGTLTNDAWNMLDRNQRTEARASEHPAPVFAADGDIHVADRETVHWDFSHAELRAYIERTDPFQKH
jgi:hypothetical protein